MYKVEKGIPIPPKRGGGRPIGVHAREARTYPWEKMSKGDSFLIPRAYDRPENVDKKHCFTITGVRNMRTPFERYAARHQYDKKAGYIGTRIWRIK